MIVRIRSPKKKTGIWNHHTLDIAFMKHATNSGTRYASSAFRSNQNQLAILSSKGRHHVSPHKTPSFELLPTKPFRASSLSDAMIKGHRILNKSRFPQLQQCYRRTCVYDDRRRYSNNDGTKSDLVHRGHIHRLHFLVERLDSVRDVVHAHLEVDKTHTLRLSNATYSKFK